MSIQVSGIAPTTSEDKLHEFFSFCGKIDKVVDFQPPTATIQFEKPSAAKTALMLDGGSLDGTQLKVTSDTVHQDEEHHDDHTKTPIDQTDKPRAGIAAEYLAMGYQLSDNILHRAIEMDRKQGISRRFLTYMHSLDTTLGARTLGPDQTISGKIQSTVNAATQQAKSMDEQRGISKTAGDYYSKALASPFGQKVFEFYTNTTKQVRDIHEEAMRIAGQHKAAAAAAEPEPETHPTTQGAPNLG